MSWLKKILSGYFYFGVSGHYLGKDISLEQLKKILEFKFFQIHFFLFIIKITLTEAIYMADFPGSLSLFNSVGRHKM